MRDNLGSGLCGMCVESSPSISRIVVSALTDIACIGFTSAKLGILELQGKTGKALCLFGEVTKEN